MIQPSLTGTHSGLWGSGPQLWVESGWAVCLPGWLVSNHLSGLCPRVGSEDIGVPPSVGSMWGLTDDDKVTALSS